MRRKTPNREYPRDTHKLDRKARPEQVVEWIKDRIAADGGKATFIGFGRTDHRLFGKAQRLLPDEYHTRLILPYSADGTEGQPTWRERRSEYRLTVTRHNTPGPQPYFSADTLS